MLVWGEAGVCSWGGGGRQGCDQCKLPWNYTPAHPLGSPQAKTVSVAPLLKDEAKCHGANCIKFCKFSYPPHQDDIQSAIGHGPGASYLAASHAQELLGRVLAGADKIMKYMKARCSGLAGYISMPPGPPRSLNFARSTLVPQKNYSSSCTHCIIWALWVAWRSENPCKGRKPS